jgi:hypothetical protein
MPLLHKQSLESFSWNGTDYTTTQLVQESLKMDVLQIKLLNLTVTPKPGCVTTQTICSGNLSLGMVLIIK